jgi:hypothetical protein
MLLLCRRHLGTATTRYNWGKASSDMTTERMDLPFYSLLLAFSVPAKAYPNPAQASLQAVPVMTEDEYEYCVSAVPTGESAQQPSQLLAREVFMAARAGTLLEVLYISMLLLFPQVNEELPEQAWPHWLSGMICLDKLSFPQ